MVWDIGSYKFWCSGVLKGKNGVVIVVDNVLRDRVLEVKWVKGGIMVIKLVIGGTWMVMVSVYVS